MRVGMVKTLGLAVMMVLLLAVPAVSADIGSFLRQERGMPSAELGAEAAKRFPGVDMSVVAETMASIGNSPRETIYCLMSYSPSTSIATIADIAKKFYHANQVDEVIAEIKDPGAASKAAYSSPKKLIDYAIDRQMEPELIGKILLGTFPGANSDEVVNALAIRGTSPEGAAIVFHTCKPGMSKKDVAALLKTKYIASEVDAAVNKVYR